MKYPPSAILVVLALGTVAARAETTISHEPLSCLPVDTSAQVVAGTPASVSSARVYFRPDSGTSDYFVEMRRGSGDGWVGFLPAAISEQTAVTYRVEMKDSDGKALRTPPRHVRASVACPVRMTDEERRMSKNLVIGLTAAGQPVVPVGFSPVGIVARITPGGVLETVLAGSTPSTAQPVESATTRTGPAPLCAGCGTLTIGGTSSTGVGPDVLPTPPPVSPVRPNSGRN